MAASALSSRGSRVVLVALVLAMCFACGSKSGEQESRWVQIPGTDVEIEPPLGYLVDELGQGLHCSTFVSPDCDGVGLVIRWSVIEAETNPEQMLDNEVAAAQANGIRGYPVDIKRIQIDGNPAAEFELSVKLENGDPGFVAQIWVVHGTRRYEVEMSTKPEKNAAIGALLESARRIRFSDKIAPRKLGWKVPRSSGFRLHRSSAFAEFYGPGERPTPGAVRIEVHLGCSTTETTKATQQEIRDAAVAAARKQNIDPQEVGDITVGKSRAIEIIGPRATTSGDPRTAWMVVVPQPGSIVSLLAVHPGQRSDELVTRYRAFARDMQVDTQRRVTCGERLPTVVTGSLGR